VKIFGRANVLDGSDGRDPALIIERQNEDGRRAYLVEALTRSELTSSERRVFHSRRAARTSSSCA
jgi:hypothetical protein